MRRLPLLVALSVLIASCASGSGGMDSGPPPMTDSATGCAPGQIVCTGICTDPMSDPANCGSCGMACAGGELCTAGVCGRSCPSGTPLLCGDACVDPMTDEMACGDCDTVCTAVEACRDGVCATTCTEPEPSQCGDECVDFDTNEDHCGGCVRPCGTAEMCVRGVCEDPCDPGLVYCGAGCIDPATDDMYCGASGDCTGSDAGATCATDEVCVAGVCDDSDPLSCNEALMMGRSTGDGMYRVDPDGVGSGAPMDVYCDMTTDGGGWTLTYKIKSSIASGTNPWWNMVMPGSGTAFPTDLSVPSTPFEGPTLATRAAYTTATGATEWRATTMRSSAIVFDMVSSYTDTNGQAMRCFAAGTCSSATQTCSASASGRVLANSLPGPLTAGQMGFICDVGWTDCSFCVDWSSVRTDASAGGSTASAVRYVGDSSISITDATTYYWVR